MRFELSEKDIQEAIGLWLTRCPNWSHVGETHIQLRCESNGNGVGKFSAFAEPIEKKAA